MTVTITHLSPPPWIEERLRSCPRAGKGVNTWLFSTARALAPYFSEAELVELLQQHSAGCGRVVTEREIVGQVRRGILASGRRLQGCGKGTTITHVPRVEFNPAALQALDCLRLPPVPPTELLALIEAAKKVDYTLSNAPDNTREIVAKRFADEESDDGDPDDGVGGDEQEVQS